MFKKTETCLSGFFIFVGGGYQHINVSDLKKKKDKLYSKCKQIHNNCDRCGNFLHTLKFSDIIIKKFSIY